MKNENWVPVALTNLVKAMQHTPADRARLVALVGNVSEALEWLDSQARRVAPPVVFSFELPGYVQIGFEDDYKTLADPNMTGLSAAWEIFLHGDNAQFVFFAADRGLSPNALRNALDRAAEWVDRYCPPLAEAIRAITIHKDGSASIDPAYVPPLRLSVFSTCAATCTSLPRASIGVSNWTKEPHHERETEDRGHRQGKGRSRAGP
ncbi:MAG: hypothetical protein AB1544_11450 [Pseudomonadota bacterium]|jgi:hypothetical protein